MDQTIIKLGTLSHGSALISGCANPVYAGHMVTAFGFVKCHVKLLDKAGFIVESICAWALRRAEIPAPEPYWVQVNKSVLPAKSIWPYGDTDRFMCFGTKTIDGARTFRHSESHDPAQELIKWSYYSVAAVFDEAIANDDRDMHNILTNGKQHWLIDHSRAFANNYRNPGAMKDVEPLFTNKLLKLLANQELKYRLKFAKQIKDACGEVFEVLKHLPYDSFSMEKELKEALQHFLDARLERLIEHCMRRIDTPMMDFHK